MNIERFAPTDRLKPFVKAYLIIASEHGMDNRILPDTALVMALRFQGSTAFTDRTQRENMPAAALTGLRHAARMVHYAQQTAMLLVQFHDGGAAAFLRQPLHVLSDQSVALSELLPRDAVAALEDRLCAAASHAQRIAHTEQFLLSLLHEPEQDRIVREALRQIHAAQGTARIGEILKDLPLSRDAFEKRFRRLVGTSPKQFSIVVRLRHVIDTHTGQDSLTDAAYRAGYFDQAHFIKDFTAFTGQTPGLFFATKRSW
ncbi:helix-turn-helix domain-containing protein [Dawidia soli]|uniref:Helix-turn-helix domain-containing protein n=1 Tax=Dawidia soli TaxID=2782352 RepID=A0AAP2GL34_9BACT|nr:helix-turn-helix domain-containing protein [Dawidia soli]MBT1689693.1 helix-turn-helix domain-containing protein [Dawidia soli]